MKDIGFQTPLSREARVWIKTIYSDAKAGKMRGAPAAFNKLEQMRTVLRGHRIKHQRVANVRSWKF